jgi:hypothetical protein
MAADPDARKTGQFGVGDFARMREVDEGVLKAAPQDHGQRGSHGELLTDDGGG